MKLIRLLFNWLFMFIFIVFLPVFVLFFLVLIVLDEIIKFVRHNKKYLLDGTDWIVEVFK